MEDSSNVYNYVFGNTLEKMYCNLRPTHMNGLTVYVLRKLSTFHSFAHSFALLHKHN